MAEDFDTDYEDNYEEDYAEEERNLEFEVSELKQKLSLLQKTKEAQRTIPCMMASDPARKGKHG